MVLLVRTIDDGPGALDLRGMSPARVAPFPLEGAAPSRGRNALQPDGGYAMLPPYVDMAVSAGPHLGCFLFHVKQNGGVHGPIYIRTHDDPNACCPLPPS